MAESRSDVYRPPLKSLDAKQQREDIALNVMRF
jgi:hypothetical protein